MLASFDLWLIRTLTWRDCLWLRRFSCFPCCWYLSSCDNWLCPSRWHCHPSDSLNSTETRGKILLCCCWTQKINPSNPCLRLVKRVFSFFPGKEKTVTTVYLQILFTSGLILAHKIQFNYIFFPWCWFSTRTLTTNSLHPVWSVEIHKKKLTFCLKYVSASTTNKLVTELTFKFNNISLTYYRQTSNHCTDEWDERV